MVNGCNGVSSRAKSLLLDYRSLGLILLTAAQGEIGLQKSFLLNLDIRLVVMVPEVAQ